MKNRSQVSDITIDFHAASGSARTDLSRGAERELATFYKSSARGALPDLVHKARNRRRWGILLVAIVLIVGVAVAALLFFNGGVSKFGEESVRVSLAAPTAAPSGQVVEYRFSLTNDQGVELKQAELNMRYPSGFTFTQALPEAENAEGTRFALGNIPAQGASSLVIRGSLVGEVGERKELAAVLTYEPENLKAQFAKTMTASTEVVASVVSLEVLSPPQLPLDQPLVLTVNYHNSSTGKLTGLATRLIVPGGFELEVPKLEPVTGSTSTWKLADLEPRAEGTFELRGRFTTAAQPGSQELRLAVGFAGSSSTDFAVQEEKVIVLALVKSHLTLQLTANEVVLKSTIDLGQELAYELSFVNEGELPLGALILTAALDPRYLDFSSLKDDAFGTAQASAGTITWTKSNLPILESLPPGGRGTIRFRMNAVLFSAGLASPLQFSARVTATGTQVVDGAAQALTAESNEIVTKVNTQLQLQVEGRYFTDELVKLGSGPLPPKVAETTTYVIFWHLGNTLSEAENIEVTTTLPQDVTWTGQATVTAGQRLTYNPNTREVRWNLNRLPAGAGAPPPSGFPRPEATFEVAVTPGPQDADKILVLTKTTTATARDSFSGSDLIATAKFITTELDDDLGAQGKGVVVR